MSKAVAAVVLVTNGLVLMLSLVGSAIALTSLWAFTTWPAAGFTAVVIVIGIGAFANVLEALDWV